ncbi:hypothetical protein GCM10028774_66160 [Spirosoma jeollabukense]
MSIEGIPQENISIDQQQKLITLVLPPTLPSLDLKPHFTFSPQAKLADEWVFHLDINFRCWTNSDGYIGNTATNGERVLVKLVNRVDNKRQSSHYTVMLKRAGPLRIKTLPAPTIYELSGISQVIVPAENVFGTPLIEFIAVTQTGALSPRWIGPGGGPMAYQLLNGLKIPLAGYSGTFSLKPGLHDLDLWLNDGTKVHTTGAILVK